MSSHYPDELLIACRAGRGVIILVEGQTQFDDPSFYQRWFGDRAPEMSFFAQNGWHQVSRAVAELRRTYPHRAVHGIVDRDFRGDDLVAAQYREPPADGVWYTPSFTLENELLAPIGWSRVAEALGRGTLSDWAPADVEQRIADAYRACLPVAAHNWIVDEISSVTSGPARAYIRHPNGAQGAAERLRVWGQQRSAVTELGDLYEERVALLRERSPEEWPRRVDGKAVLKVLTKALNDALPKKDVPYEYLVGIYLDKHPEPSAELSRLIDAILAVPRPITSP